MIDTQHIVTLKDATVLVRSKHHSDINTSLFTNVSISARAGRSLVLLGPNGCGKSSIARALIGLIPLSSGKRSATPDMQFAYMPQDYRNAFFPWLSIRRNIDLMLRKKKNADEGNYYAIKKAEDQLHETLERLKLPIDLDRHPYEVSGGQLQLALLASALAMPAQICIFDEPFSAIDYKRRVIASQIISEAISSRRDKGWVIITHDISEGVRLADTVAAFGPISKISALIEVNWERPRCEEIHDSADGIAALRAVQEAISAS